MSDQLNRQALAFSKLAYRQFKRLVIFQRPPKSGETQDDDFGYPSQGDAAHINVDPENPIPCNFTIGQRRDQVIGGQLRTVTNFKVTIPSLYNSGGVWKQVDFSTNYRAHILTKDEFNLERFFQVVGSGDDLGPDITFDAVELQELV